MFGSRSPLTHACNIFCTTIIITVMINAVVRERSFRRFVPTYSRSVCKSTTQWAAVITCLFDINVPPQPQFMRRRLLRLKLSYPRATIHGQAPAKSENTKPDDTRNDYACRYQIEYDPLRVTRVTFGYGRSLEM